jgi:transcriptional regulator with XRE-family HTH domain
MESIENERMGKRWQLDARRCLAEFGKRVRLRRNEIGLTQAKLGDRCGLHRTYVADIEAGRRNPSLVNLLKMSAALETSLSEVCAGVTWVR